MDKLSDLASKLAPYLRQPRWADNKVALTSSAWDGGDDFSDVSTYALLDLSAVFGVPAKVRKVLARIAVRDSATAVTTGLYFLVAQSGAATVYSNIWRPIGDDMWCDKTEIIQCDDNGDFWYKINASGTNTMNIIIQIQDWYI